jgi:prepilin-type N-terminal cleavage/methylation domain-containing protein
MHFLTWLYLYRKYLEAAAPNVTKGPSERYLGFTLIEWLVALALVGTIASIGVPAYYKYMDKADIADAMADIRSIEQFIVRYEVRNAELPDSLADAGADGLIDPWDNPYQYLRIDGAGLKGKGAVRNDKKLNPINSIMTSTAWARMATARNPSRPRSAMMISFTPPMAPSLALPSTTSLWQ